MKDIFLAISAAVEQLNTVRWVDFDLGQLEQEQPPVSFPCTLVGFDNGTFENLGNLGQQGIVQVSIRVAFRTFERTHSKAAASFRNVGLEHLDILQAIHTKLNGLNGTSFTALTRVGMATERRADLRVYNLTYTTLMTDMPASSYTPWSEATDADLEFCHTFTFQGIQTAGVGYWVIPDFLVS